MRFKVLLITLLILVPFVYSKHNIMYLNNKKFVYDSIPYGFNYATPLIIRNYNTYPLSNYQVKIVLTPSWDGWNHVKSDGSDIRFVTLDGVKIPYYIEEWDKNNKKAVIWIKIPYINSFNSETLFMMFGNQNVVSESNGEQVFEFFDDFNTNTGRWTLTGTNSGKSYEIKNGYLHLPLLTSNVGGPDTVVYTSSPDLTKVTIDVKMRIYKTSTQVGVSGLIFSSEKPLSTHYLGFGGTDKGHFGVSDWKLRSSTSTTSVTELYGFTPDYTKFHIWTIKKNGGYYKLYYDGVYKTQIQSSMSVANYIIFDLAYDHNELWVDWVRIRKYSDIEPYVILLRTLPSLFKVSIVI